MKSVRNIFVYTLLCIVVIGFFSCRKIRQDNLVKGLWQLQYFKIDTTTIKNRNNPFVRSFIDTAIANQSNFLHSLLPGYTANKDLAYYRIKYERDDIAFSYYNIGDSNIYTLLGRWSLLKQDELYQKADNFIEGYFEIINKGNINEYELVSERNYMRLLDDTVSVAIKIKRMK